MKSFLGDRNRVDTSALAQHYGPAPAMDLVGLDQFFFADGFRGIALFEGGEDVGVKPGVVRFHYGSNYGLWIHYHAGSLAKPARG